MSVGGLEGVEGCSSERRDGGVTVLRVEGRDGTEVETRRLEKGGGGVGCATDPTPRRETRTETGPSTGPRQTPPGS